MQVLVTQNEKRGPTGPLLLGRIARLFPHAVFALKAKMHPEHQGEHVRVS